MSFVDSGQVSLGGAVIDWRGKAPLLWRRLLVEGFVWTMVCVQVVKESFRKETRIHVCTRRVDFGCESKSGDLFPPSPMCTFSAQHKSLLCVSCTAIFQTWISSHTHAGSLRGCVDLVSCFPLFVVSSSTGWVTRTTQQTYELVQQRFQLCW